MDHKTADLISISMRSANIRGVQYQALSVRAYDDGIFADCDYSLRSHSVNTRRFGRKIRLFPLDNRVTLLGDDFRVIITESQFIASDLKHLYSNPCFARNNTDSNLFSQNSPNLFREHEIKNQVQIDVDEKNCSKSSNRTLAKQSNVTKDSKTSKVHRRSVENGGTGSRRHTSDEIGFPKSTSKTVSNLYWQIMP